MTNKNIKNSINVSDKLDNYILKGIEQGRLEKKFINKKNKYRTLVKVSSIFLIGTLALGIINPDIIRAIPIIGKALEGFDSSNFGSPTDKYLKYSKGVELVSENKKAKIILNDVIIDENMFMFGIIVESDVLKEYKGKGDRDFINVDSYITLNGKSVEISSHRVRKIDDTTGAVIISGNIAELNLDDNIEVDFKIDSIRGTKEARGNWKFKFNTSKVEGSKRIPIKETHDMKGQKLVIDEVVISPLSNTVIMRGIDDTENYTLQSTKYKVFDDKGNMLKSDEVSSSVYNETGEYFSKLEIRDDLENTKYIELIPYSLIETINKKMEGFYIDLLTTSGSGEREEVIISRNPTKEELKSGYALSKVYYNLNIDKNKEFLSLEEFKNYKIDVNDKEKVIIQNIIVSKENTKVTMKIQGNYNAINLSQLVIFDEQMSDTTRGESERGVFIEDEKEGIYSIILDPIDTSKKYKIAVPMTKNIDLNNKYKIRVNLN